MNHFTPTQEMMQYTTANDKTQEYQKPNNLKEVQINYLLDKLQEESAECIQAVSKIRRFGAKNKHPERTTNNLQELIQELEDFLAIVGVLEGLGYMDLTQSKDNIKLKAQQLLR